MPYGYYQFVRFAAFVGFAFFAYSSFENKEKLMPFIYVSLALLFQPFIKIALGRLIWNVVDVGVAVFLIATLFIKSPTKNEKQT